MKKRKRILSLFLIFCILFVFAKPQKIEAKVTPAPSQHTHTCDAFIINKEPTCTEDGSKSKYCNTCGSEVEKKPIPALGHDYSDEFTIDKEPTCTEDGFKSKHCSRCDSNVEEIVISSVGHDWDDKFVVDIEPTTTTVGTMSIHCKNCSVTKNITEILVVVTGRAFDELGRPIDISISSIASNKKIDLVKSLCNSELVNSESDINSLIQIEANDFDGVATTIFDVGNIADVGDYIKILHFDEKSQKWELIGTEEVDANKTITGEFTSFSPVAFAKVSKSQSNDDHIHTYNEGVITKNPTCADAGIKTYTCTDCDDSYTEKISKLDHDFGEWISVKGATCTEDGMKSRECKICHFTEKAKVLKIGHVYDNEFTIDKEPTCTEMGSKSRHCSRCDDKIEAINIPAKKHIPVTKGKREATTSTTGYTGDTYCSVCNKLLSKGKVIDKSPTKDTNYVPGYQEEINNVTYQIIKSNTVSVFKIKKGTKNVVIKDTITLSDGKKYKVTTIDKNVFANDKKLKSITVGKNISKIDNKAFSNCKNLKKITFKSANIKTIKKDSFKGINKNCTIIIKAKDKKDYNALVKKIKASVKGSKTNFKFKRK